MDKYDERIKKKLKEGAKKLLEEAIELNSTLSESGKDRGYSPDVTVKLFGHRVKLPLYSEEVCKGLQTLIAHRTQMPLPLPPKPSPLDSLTEREWEVLDRLFKGRTEEETGKELFISKHTVRSHRRSVYKKVGKNNLYEITKLYVEYEQQHGLRHTPPKKE